MLRSSASLSAITTNLDLVNTVSSTTGVITKGGARFIHNYAAAGSDGQNTFVGLNAGNFTMGPGGGASSLGSNNSVGGGTNALQTNTTGFQNSVGAGVNALFSNTTGNQNSVGAGVSALQATTTGFGNSVGGGVSTLFANTTGSYNSVGAGLSALFSNTTGSQNSVGAGVSALYEVTTGNNNTADGFNTGRGITTGSGNSIFGAQVTGLAAGLTNNIILASGDGVIKARHDGTNWALTGALHVTTTISTGSYTVATLPAGAVGDMAYVTDATAPTYLAALTGGGGVRCPVFRNATIWVSA